VSDDFDQKWRDSDGEKETREDDPFGWPDWARRPEEDDEEGAAARDPYSHDPYAREPATEVVYDSHAPEHRTRDPLARLFPGLPRGVRVTLDWILTIAGAILIVLALKEWVVNPYRIPSSSMEPTLNCAKPAIDCLGNSSDRVLACRICLDFGPPSRGDIVVFNTPSEAALKCGEGGTFVKRVIGLPGDTVREDRHGFIWIRGPDSTNWVKLKEPYLSAQRRLADTGHFRKTWQVSKDGYFMMGDNRAESCDSRAWGSVPRSKLIGTVFFVYWPPDRIGFR
jgi:signal peptidase I